MIAKTSGYYIPRSFSKFVNSSICKTNGILSIPLTDMKSEEPMFNICHSQLFMNASVPLKDGLINLEDDQEIIISSLYNGKRQTILRIRLEDIDECSTLTTLYYIIGCFAFAVILLVVILLLRKKMKEIQNLRSRLK